MASHFSNRLNYIIRKESQADNMLPHPLLNMVWYGMCLKVQ
jgi:hypothetical protein